MLTRRSISAGLTAVVFSGSAEARGAPSTPWPNGASAAVSLTYDDGLDSQLDNAAGELEAARLRATFFLTLENMDARLKDWVELARADLRRWFSRCSRAAIRVLAAATILSRTARACCLTPRGGFSK